ncbi:UNVERIFIED_CONTAM: hypothetical protein Slati_0171300 [Sesamum latifolium]|uniref:Uncharacterized protein n=1 Tax=Sesamum latifolium TaxID=2727402 RepID=A0AAW2YAJ9_9LAMI
MRAALMWTVNDLPAYGMASGWSTARVMRCPICIDDTRAFHLQHGRKGCYFDCHRQFLPELHPYRRNKKAFTMKGSSGPTREIKRNRSDKIKLDSYKRHRNNRFPRGVPLEISQAFDVV